MSALAGYGFHASAIAGFTDVVGWPDLGPDGPWMAYTDAIAPRFLTTAVLAALDRRARTGEGCRIEGAQLEIALQLLAPEILDQQITGRTARRIGNRRRIRLVVVERLDVRGHRRHHERRVVLPGRRGSRREVRLDRLAMRSVNVCTVSAVEGNKEDLQAVVGNYRHGFKSVARVEVETRYRSRIDETAIGYRLSEDERRLGYHRGNEKC